MRVVLHGLPPLIPILLLDTVIFDISKITGQQQLQKFSYLDNVPQLCGKTRNHGFHGAGGGGGVGNIGGTAENIVFLSIPPLFSPERATRAATRPAFPASVGSV